MNKRDRKAAKATVLWLKKGYNLHREGDSSKLAAYSRKYERMLDYRWADGHSPSVQAKLDRESTIRFEINVSHKYDKYWYSCLGCNASKGMSWKSHPSARKVWLRSYLSSFG